MALIGVGTVLVDGAPFWGADGGGPPAAIPGFAYLVLSILGIAITWRRGLILALSCAALFLGIAFLDWLRPATERTHLGRFIQSIIDGGALDIVIRKGETEPRHPARQRPTHPARPGGAPLRHLRPGAPHLVGSRALQRSFQTLPTLRAGLVALVITLTIGFLINDSARPSRPSAPPWRCRSSWPWRSARSPTRRGWVPPPVGTVVVADPPATVGGVQQERDRDHPQAQLQPGRHLTPQPQGERLDTGVIPITRPGT